MARVQLSSLPAGTILQTGTFLPAAGATAFVYTHGTTNQVPVYTTETGVSIATQPVTADTNGQLTGYWVQAAQVIDIVATYSGGAATSGMAEVLDATDSTGESVKTVTGTYTFASTDETLLADATAGAFTTTLPNAASFTRHLGFAAINTNSNLATLQTASSSQLILPYGATQVSFGALSSPATLNAALLVATPSMNWQVL